MRAYELYERSNFIALGLYDPADDRLGRREPDDTRKPRITLRDLNKLKHRRRARQRELDKKAELARTMYGDPALEHQAADREAEFEKREHELQMVKDKIQLRIDGAEIDQEAKDHISDMARSAMKKRSKSG